MGRFPVYKDAIWSRASRRVHGATDPADANPNVAPENVKLTDGSQVITHGSPAKMGKDGTLLT